jgi:hypothetical protein
MDDVAIASLLLHTRDGVEPRLRDLSGFEQKALENGSRLRRIGAMKLHQQFHQRFASSLAFQLLTIGKLAGSCQGLVDHNMSD